MSITVGIALLAFLLIAPIVWVGTRWKRTSAHGVGLAMLFSSFGWIGVAGLTLIHAQASYTVQAVVLFPPLVLAMYTVAYRSYEIRAAKLRRIQAAGLPWSRWELISPSLYGAFCFGVLPFIGILSTVYLVWVNHGTMDDYSGKALIWGWLGAGVGSAVCVCVGLFLVQNHMNTLRTMPGGNPPSTLASFQ